MQRFLTKLTPEHLEQQRKRIAAEAAVSAAAAAADAAAAAARQSETGPGRPRKEKSIIPASASICSASGSDEEMDPVPEATKKRAYTSWLTSDDFHYIHDTVRRRQSFRVAVRELQERFPKLKTQERGKFDLLNASTLRKWYSRDSTGTITLKRDYERAKTDRQRDIGSYVIDSSQIELSGDEAE